MTKKVCISSNLQFLTYIYVVSPLWALEAWRKSFFQRLGICWLHVELQGVFKHHIAAALAELKPKEIEGSLPPTLLQYLIYIYVEINRRLRIALSEHPTLTPLWTDVLHKNKDDSGNKKAKVLPRSGAILFSVQQVLIGCLLGCVPFLYIHFPFEFNVMPSILRKTGAKDDPKTMKILEGLASYITALNLAIQETLTEADKDEYNKLFLSWLGSYLEVEPLKRVCIRFSSFLQK